MLQSIVAVLALAAVAVVFSSPVAPAGTVVGWNDLLGENSFFEDGVNTIQTKSSDDAVILGQFEELVGQDEVMATAYLKYRTIFKKTNDASQDRIDQLKKTMLKVATHNLEAAAGKHSWTMAVNHFADMSSSEMSVMMGSFSPNSTRTAGPYMAKHGVAKPPKSLNYVKEGIISKVKQQGDCGTCAMFASCAILEAADAQTNSRKPLDLSPQELADCAIPTFTCPKGGSSAGDSLQYMIDNGISTWKKYPYAAWPVVLGNCKKDSTPRAVYASTQALSEDNSEKSLMQNLADNGPLVVYIYASDDFQNYAKGVYPGEECGDKEINHAVTLVGYGKEKGKKYWLIKNSWDTTWGEKGYGKLKYSVCGILGTAYSVTAQSD